LEYNKTQWPFCCTLFISSSCRLFASSSLLFNRVLEELFPDAHPVHKSVKDNHRHWEKICALIKLRRGGSCEQMSYDQILALEEEANNLHEDEIKSVQQNGH
jgi:hypothetical protein